MNSESASKLFMSHSATPWIVAGQVPLSVGLAVGNNLLEHKRNFPLFTLASGQGVFPHPVFLNPCIWNDVCIGRQYRERVNPQQE